VPISLACRADVAWLLPPERTVPLESARWDAQAVFEALSTHGALFFDDLLTATNLLPAQLDDALGELASLGLVTSDGFAAIRHLMVKHHNAGRRVRRARRPRGRAYAAGGRWSKFPPLVRATETEERAERWAWLLLNRYGVMFRDLLTREAAAPPWRGLAAVYRRLEMRGEIRGGRFVAGVAGEQFALPDAVERLRKHRDEQMAGESWQLISAADPLNFVGIITEGPRVPATRNNRVLFRSGRPIVAREAGAVRWVASVDDATKQQALALLGGPDALRRAEIAAAERAAFEVVSNGRGQNGLPQNGDSPLAEPAGNLRAAGR
jgi:ATP-dependent Lhr-like helicase